MPLGRQCLTCKKRRVKCGSEEPHCKKCANDGHICLGYAKALKWKQVEPSGKAQFKDVRETEGRSSRLTSEPDSNLLVRSQALVPKRHLPGIDEQTYRFAQGVEYFNTVMMPDMSAIYGQTSILASVREWLQAPAILRSNLIVAVLKTQSIRAGRTLPELYSHRGRAFRSLSTYLRLPHGQTPIGSLVAVMSIMHQEIHHSPVDGFAVHLQAARKIIESSGGIQQCLAIWPMAFNMIVFFVQADIISMTTMHTKALDLPHTEAQHSHLTAFSGSEVQLMDSPLPCPLPMLRSIVHINRLRALPPASGGAASTTWKSQYLEIIQEVYGFDALRWAYELSDILQAPISADSLRVEATNEWTYLARCYQAATMIYLIESTKSQRALDASFVDGNQLSAALVKCAHSQLLLNLLRLFASYPDRNTTAERPTLWRFTLWPVMIYAYNVTLRGAGTSPRNRLLGDKTVATTLYEELRGIGFAINSQSALEGADLFEELAAKRPLGGMNWDEGFVQSIIFYL